eukprot:9500806-Pyramimonas_sp.AAC.3
MGVPIIDPRPPVPTSQNGPHPQEILCWAAARPHLLSISHAMVFERGVSGPWPPHVIIAPCECLLDRTNNRLRHSRHYMLVPPYPHLVSSAEPLQHHTSPPPLSVLTPPPPPHPLHRSGRASQRRRLAVAAPPGRAGRNSSTSRVMGRGGGTRRARTPRAAPPSPPLFNQGRGFSALRVAGKKRRRPLA